MLDVMDYLLKVNKELTSVGAVFIRILDISKVEDSQVYLCKTCYCTVFAVQKLKMNYARERESWS